MLPLHTHQEDCSREHTHGKAVVRETLIGAMNMQDDLPAAKADTTAKVGVRPSPVSVQKQVLSPPASPGDFDEGVGSMMAELNLKVSASGGALMHQQVNPQPKQSPHQLNEHCCIYLSFKLVIWSELGVNT